LEILRVIACFYPYVTGPANQAYHISLNLEKRGIDSPIFTSDYGAETSPPFEMMGNVKVKRFSVYGRFLQFFLTPGMIPELVRINPDIIHVHGYRNFQSNVAYLSSKMKNIPLVVNPHGTALAYEVIAKTRIRKTPYALYDVATSKGILKNADCVVASTRQEFDELIRFGIERQRVKIVPVGVDIKKYDSIKAFRDEDILNVLFVGRISRNRNVGLLVEAFASVAKEREDVRLTIVGGEGRSCFIDRLGYLGNLKKRVADMGLSDYVEFAGPLYDTSLIEAYKSADIFVYTSLYESFGQTILEAAACGLPIISTPVGVANDLIVDGKSGFFTSFDDPGRLSEKMLLLLCDEGLRRKFSRNIQATVREKYEWDRIIGEYLAIYRGLMSGDQQMALPVSSSLKL